MLQKKACPPNDEHGRRVDLHVHTNCSDGTFTPEEVVEYAVKIGLSAVAITDHDSVEGVEPALKAALDKNIEIVSGIEFTTEMQNTEIHILGYFIEYNKKWFIDELKALRILREKRMTRMLDCLAQKDIKLTMDDVRGVSGEGSVGRLHLAKLLFKKGYVSSVYEAFVKFIGAGKSCYVRGDRISPVESISIINKAGGVAVLAHPNTMGKDEFIPKLVKAGLKGLEVYHSDHNEQAVNQYKKVAQDLGLLITGGSDCHGMGKGKVVMGTVTVGYDVVEKLKDAR